jgi:hypothetical protein
MWEWITSNAKVLTLFATALTLIVWMVYGQLLAASMRHAKTPRLVVEQGSGHGLDSICVVTNMSMETIYLQGVSVSLQTKDRTHRYMLADSAKTTERERGITTRRETCQGPLKPNETLNLGTFRALLDEAAVGTGLETGDDGAPLGLEAVTVTAVTSFGPKQHTVGARRRFNLDTADTPRLYAASALTEPLQGRRKARPLRGLLAQFTDVER